MNTPVNFELAKLVSQNGYSKDRYNHEHNEKEWERYGERIKEIYFPFPTIVEVVMWLYKEHAIWIRVTPIPYSDNLTHWRWEHISTNYATRSLNWKKEQDYMSPKEAYEAAIAYTLTKLI